MTKSSVAVRDPQVCPAARLVAAGVVAPESSEVYESAAWPTYFKYALGLPAAAHTPLISPGGGGIPPALSFPSGRAAASTAPRPPCRSCVQAPVAKARCYVSPALNFGKLPFFSPSRRFSSVTQAASCGGRGCLHVSVGRNSVFEGQGKACVSTFDCGKTNVI